MLNDTRGARILVVLSWIVLSGAAGCSQRSGLMIAGPDTVLPDNEDSAGFLDRMSSGAKVTENDAMRGVLLLMDGKDTTKTFQQRVKLLVERKVADPCWEFGSHRAITRGKLAYMVYQACKVRGGLMLAITGPNQRYCLRELEYQKIMSEGTMLTEVTGMEFVAVIGRADAFMRDKKIPTVLMGKEG